ncbi:hypothetical protein TREES_T100021962 [Tupaia chinensis]|uniref:Uncharacterized protein n=1 Tax=Tupaia chinensis TaxID=246437 RepID=L9J9S3_TUPCH|nr:hypothetical protein TREES_T100021962 [Tupaia chinensis]
MAAARAPRGLTLAAIRALVPAAPVEEMGPVVTQAVGAHPPNSRKRLEGDMGLGTGEPFYAQLSSSPQIRGSSQSPLRAHTRSSQLRVQLWLLHQWKRWGLWWLRQQPPPPELQQPPELEPPELGPQQEETGGGHGAGHWGGHLRGHFGGHLEVHLGVHLGGDWHCCWFCWQNILEYQST